MTVDEDVEMVNAGVKAMVRAKDTVEAVEAVIASVKPWLYADLRAEVKKLLVDAELMREDRDAWLAMAYRDVLALIDGGPR